MDAPSCHASRLYCTRSLFHRPGKYTGSGKDTQWERGAINQGKGYIELADVIEHASVLNRPIRQRQGTFDVGNWT